MKLSGYMLRMIGTPTYQLKDQHFIQNIWKCFNYPNSNEVDDFDPFLSTLDSTLSQVTEIGTQMEEENDDAVLEFVSQYVTATATQ